MVKRSVPLKEHNRVKEALEEEIRRLHASIEELKQERDAVLSGALRQARKNQELADALEQKLMRK